MSIPQLLGEGMKGVLFIDPPKPLIFITMCPEPKSARDIIGVHSYLLNGGKSDSKIQTHVCLPPRPCSQGGE